MITTRKLRMTGTATPPEILAAGADPDYIYAPEIAALAHLAQKVPGSNIEVVRALPDQLEIRACIFDHDGTLSSLRAGWEDIMESLMLRAVLGEKRERIEPAKIAEIEREIREFIGHSTGMQTLAQMHALAGLVRTHGYVGAADIGDAPAYKQLFNQELLKVVDARMARLRSGELTAEHFRIGAAIEFLRELHRRGITLYLASGTDQRDVIEEAQALGYAELFGGRIFGAVGDLKVDAKLTVIERMSAEHGLAGHQFAMFGDGPLEIREARKRGALAVGVASDEARAGSVNPSKRTRLVRSGADLIIPDYGYWPDLLRLMRL